MSISGLRAGAPPAGTPPLRVPQLQPRDGEDLTPSLLEEKLGSVSSPEGPHTEALFAAASVQQGLPVVQGQYLSQSSLCWALHARVWELKDHGYCIEKHTVQKKRGKKTVRYARYILKEGA